MGMLSFMKEAGEKLFGNGKAQETIGGGASRSVSRRQKNRRGRRCGRVALSHLHDTGAGVRSRTR